MSHFQQVPSPFWQLLTLAAGVAEAARARRGWEEPIVAQSWFKLRRSYAPGERPGDAAQLPSPAQQASLTTGTRAGDLGFDPLRLFPLEAAAQKDMRTRELNNGRLGARIRCCKRMQY